MTLREYADLLGIKYNSAWKQFKAGKIEGAFKTPTGIVIVPDDILETFKRMYEEEQENKNKDKD